MPCREWFGQIISCIDKRAYLVPMVRNILDKVMMQYESCSNNKASFFLWLTDLGAMQQRVSQLAWGGGLGFTQWPDRLWGKLSRKVGMSKWDKRWNFYGENITYACLWELGILINIVYSSTAKLANIVKNLEHWVRLLLSYPTTGPWEPHWY